MEYIYAAMLIHKLGGTIDEAHVKKVLEAAGGKPDEGQVRALCAAMKDVDIEKAIKEAAVVPVAAAPAASGGQAAKKEEKKEEEKKSAEQAAAGLGALFG